MIHTIISLYDVFASPQPEQVVTERISCGYAEYRSVNGKRTLSRVISTDPRVYLNSNYQPTKYYF
ncbi:MAG: YlzJ-like family protein [Oscillospiraceae bacterium]